MNIYKISLGEVQELQKESEWLDFEQSCDWKNEALVVCETEEEARLIANKYDRGLLEPGNVFYPDSYGHCLKALSYIRITFIELVDSVEDDRRGGKSSWSDYENVAEIEAIHGIMEDERREVTTAFLKALIKDKGENVEIYKDAYQCLEFGQAFSRNSCSIK